jgi:hypothetical protein
MPTVTRLTSNGVFQSLGGLGGFDEISLDSGSIFFNGTIGDYIFPTASNIVDFGTNDFTIELWIYPLTSATFNFFDGRSSSGQNAVTIASTSTQLIFFDTNGTARITGTTPLTVLAWNHVAVTRSGTDVKLFLNGVQQSTTYTSSLSYISGTNRPAIGAGGFTAGGSPLNGYMSNVRVVKNTAVYTANFTPPTAPLTPVANTSLLLTVSPQSPFSDSSNNNFTITRNGAARFNSLGPFYYPGNTSINLANTNNNPVLGSNTNIVTSTTSNGVVMVSGEFDEVSMTSQSLRFNGSSYLTIPSNAAVTLGTNDYTIEMWVYPNNNSQNAGLFQLSPSATYVQTFPSNQLSIQIWQGYIQFGSDTAWNVGNGVAANAYVANRWYHVAMTRQSGGLTRFFINGVQVHSLTETTNYTGSYLVVGGFYQLPTYVLNGNLSNFRLVKGTAVYTANFTPPQMALTAVANTSLLLNNFEAQPFVDNSSNNLTITVNGGVTANTFTPFANTQRKILNTGTMMVKEYDEITGLPIVDSSLQLWLDAGQSASYPGSGTTWTDLSGNSRTGTLTGGPTYDSAGGGSIVFDGTDDFAQCSGSLTVTAATFVAWIRRNGTQIPYSGIIYSRGSGSNVSGLAIGQTGTFNEIGYTWHGNSSTYFFTSSLTIPDLTWCMIAVSVTSTAATLYLCQSSGITTATNTTSHPSTVLDDIKIAQDEAIGDRFFKGNIAAAMIYNRALTTDEIGQNFNALRGRYGI